MALIKLRSEKTGKLYNADGVSFVELCATDGKLVGVVLVNEAMKMLEVLRPGDAAFTRYIKTYKREAGKVKDIDLTWLERKRKELMQ